MGPPCPAVFFGLEADFSSLNCRRRHVKCDEGKPACRACVKIGQNCVYPRVPSNTAHRRGASSSGSGETKGAHEESGSTPWSQSPITTQDHDHVQNADASNSLTHANDDHQLMHVDIPTNQNGQPREEQEALHAVVTSRDGAATSTASSSAANIENATAIWVDLLLKDAAAQNVDIGDLNFDSETLNIFGNSVIQSPAESHSANTQLQPHDQSSPPTKNPYLLDRIPPPLQSQRFEKQAWHSDLPLRISSEELLVFQNFVRNISLWVSAIRALILLYPDTSCADGPV